MESSTIRHDVPALEDLHRARPSGASATTAAAVAVRSITSRAAVAPDVITVRAHRTGDEGHRYPREDDRASRGALAAASSSRAAGVGRHRVTVASVPPVPS